MIQRASGKSPEGVALWVSDLGVRFIGLEGTSIGGDSSNGSTTLYAVNTPQYLSPDGLGVIVHELAHGIDETVGDERGYGESFSSHVNQYGVGWNPDWVKDGSGGFKFVGDFHGPPNDYLINPAEDFASSFASVVIETNIQLGTMNVEGTLDLSAYIQLKSSINAPPWPSFGYVDDSRRIPIQQILGLVQHFIRPFRVWFPIFGRCKTTGSVLVKGSRTL